MNRPAPLSADARRLLELGSHVEPPTPEQNDRMDRTLAALFRAGRPGPSPATGSSLGGAEPRAASVRGDAAHGTEQRVGIERSGIRIRTAPRATARLLEPLQGLRDAKLWLTFGALAATAGASFWLGRLSTPADAVAPLRAHALESRPLATRLLETSPLDVGMARPAEPEPALASASLAPAPPDVSAGTASSPTLASSAAANDPAVSAVSAAPAVIQTSLGRDKPGVPRARAPAQRPLGLAAEIEQLARAEAALRQGRAGHALAVLQQRSVQHLLEQAAALRAIAECELGVTAAARNARDVLERWPSSAFQPRIVNACRL